MVVRERGFQNVKKELYEPSERAARIPRYRLHSHVAGKRLQEFYQARDNEGAAGKKVQELLMLALACLCRCPDCMQEHVERALGVGATRDEVAEVLLIAFHCANRFYTEHSCGHFAGILEHATGARLVVEDTMETRRPTNRVNEVRGTMSDTA